MSQFPRTKSVICNLFALIKTQNISFTVNNKTEQQLNQIQHVYYLINWFTTDDFNFSVMFWMNKICQGNNVYNVSSDRQGPVYMGRCTCKYSSWTYTHYLQFLQKVSTQRRFKQLFSILICLCDLQLDLWRTCSLQHPTRGVGQDMGGLRRGRTVHKGGGRTGGWQV